MDYDKPKPVKWRIKKQWAVKKPGVWMGFVEFEKVEEVKDDRR